NCRPHRVMTQTVIDPARNHHVLFSMVTVCPKDGLERSAAFENENDLIGAAVLIILELAVRFLRPAPICCHVLIEKNRYPSGIDVAFARDLRGFQMMMAQRTVGDFF